MYKIIGADQKEYGPVAAEQIQQWIAENRANGQTKVLSEGQSDWRSLASLPEFAAALEARARASEIARSAPGASASGTAAVGGAVIEAGTTLSPDDWQLDVGSCFSRSFALLQKHFWLVVGASAIVMLVQMAMGLIPWLGGAADVLLSAVFMAGLYAFFLKLVRGQPAVIGDVFTGFNVALGPLILTGLISTLLCLVGLALCIAPGIYLFVSWLFAAPLVLERKLDFWPAMEMSRQVVGKHWWVVFALVLLCVLVHFAGMLLCGIGWFVAAPVAYGALAYAYEDIFNRPGAQQPTTMP